MQWTQKDTQRTYSHCCTGKAISITNSVCVFVALGIQHAMRMRRIVICDLSGSTIFLPHYLINGKIFFKVTEHKICVLLLRTTFV